MGSFAVSGFFPTRPLKLAHPGTVLRSLRHALQQALMLHNADAQNVSKEGVLIPWIWSSARFVILAFLALAIKWRMSLKSSQVILSLFENCVISWLSPRRSAAVRAVPLVVTRVEDTQRDKTRNRTRKQVGVPSRARYRSWRA